MERRLTPPELGADPIELTHWLCAIASPIGEEAEICEALLARAARWKAAGPATRVLNSFAVPLTRGTGGPRLALVGHTDTVRTQHDGPTRIEGDRLYGAGAADMKSGLALMIAAAEDASLSLRADVTLIFYAREEGPFAENELGPFFEKHPDLAQHDLAICLEPSYGKLQLGCMGSLHAKVVVRGRTAHSARPWQGENALHKAWPLLRDLSARAPVDATLDGLPYRAVMSATMGQAGRGRNIVPDGFELNLNYRFLPGVSLEQAEADVRAMVDGSLGENGAEVTITDRSPSAPPHRENALVRRLVESGVPAVESKQAWTDVARFATLGVPAVNWGPGDQDEAHQRNESTSVKGLHDGWKILRTFLASL